MTLRMLKVFSTVPFANKLREEADNEAIFFRLGKNRSALHRYGVKLTLLSEDPPL